MERFDQLKSFVDGLTEDEAWQTLSFLRQKFAWYAEVFDYQDGKQWWDEDENGPFTLEIWEEIVDVCEHFVERGADESFYYAVDAVANRRMTRAENPSV